MNFQHAPQKDYSSILVGALAAVAAAGACLLSFIEHRRAVQPSTLLTIYILALLAGQLIFMTAPRTISKGVRQYELSLGCAAVEVLFLIVENVDKKSILRKRYQQCAPEETIGILGRTFFWWINPILRDGNRSILVADDLPSLDKKLSSSGLRNGIIHAWRERSIISIVVSNGESGLIDDQVSLTGNGSYPASCYVS